MADSRNTRTRKMTRDIEKVYEKAEFIKKLRRLADALENDSSFVIQIAGERVRVPKGAVINIEHEKGKSMEEIEFQIKWRR